MRQQFKLGLYVVTVVGTFLFGTLFLQGWRKASDAPGSAPEKALRTATASTAKEAKASPAPGTNAAIRTTETSAPPASVSGATGAVASGVSASVPRPEDAGESAAEVTAESEVVPATPPTGGTRGLGRMITWGLLAVVSLVALGALLAYDISQYAAHRATEALFNDRGEELTATEYEKIEKVYADGDFLETVRMLREFLKSNPREVHAQIRIAEIYEKDLNNPLAAALEYEEVLKLPLEPARRGWTGIHLVNLYNRLEKPRQAVELMQRICVECPGTPAAGKARERLEAMGESVPEPPAAGGAGPSSDPGLPPGFRKKR